MNRYIAFVCRLITDARRDLRPGRSRRLPKPVKKLVTDMHHEVRIQAIVTYYGSKLGERKTKKDAREMQLTREQYLEVNEEHQY